jgi:NitT/TauT family transport system substrate-binding protein
MQRSAILAFATVVAFATTGPHAMALDKLTITEPNHVVGYLPLYVTQKLGFFAEEGIEVKWTTIENGSGPTNALLTGQVFAMLGGPEHLAYAKIKGGEPLKAIAGVLTRSSVYLMAAKGQEPAKPPATNAEWASYLKGKRIGTGAYGSTPNSVTRFMLSRFGLDAKADVQLIETPSAAIIAAAKAGQVQFGVVNEPLVTRGIRSGIWGEPVYNVPVELGPYAWATVNVRADTIAKQPQLVERFMRALVKGLKATYSDTQKTVTIAKEEFPTTPIEDLTAAVERSLKDQLWSKDGFVEPQAWTTAETVVRDAGLLKQDVAYGDIMDMRYVKR